MNMFHFLKTPFPDFKKKKFVIRGTLCVLILVIILATQFTYVLNTGFIYFFRFVIGFTLISGGCLSIVLYLFSMHIKNRWTLGKYFLFTFINASTTLIFISIYHYFFQNIRHVSFLIAFRNLAFFSYLIGFSVFAGLYFWTKYRHMSTDLQKKEDENQKLVFRVLKDTSEHKLITLCGVSGKESLTLFPQELIYLESTGNYVLIKYKLEEKVLQKTFRTTLSKIEETLNEYPFLYRCHRAFIVNIFRIEEMNGSKIRLESVKTELPVSKTCKADFQSRINTYGILSQK